MNALLKKAITKASNGADTVSVRVVRARNHQQRCHFQGQNSQTRSAGEGDRRTEFSELTQRVHRTQFMAMIRQTTLYMRPCVNFQVKVTRGGYAGGW